MERWNLTKNYLMISLFRFLVVYANFYQPEPTRVCSLSGNTYTLILHLTHGTEEEPV